MALLVAGWCAGWLLAGRRHGLRAPVAGGPRADGERGGAGQGRGGTAARPLAGTARPRPATARGARRRRRLHRRHRRARHGGGRARHQGRPAGRVDRQGLGLPPRGRRGHRRDPGVPRCRHRPWRGHRARPGAGRRRRRAGLRPPRPPGRARLRAPVGRSGGHQRARRRDRRPAPPPLVAPADRVRPRRRGASRRVPADRRPRRRAGRGRRGPRPRPRRRRCGRPGAGTAGWRPDLVPHVPGGPRLAGRGVEQEPRHRRRRHATAPAGGHRRVGRRRAAGRDLRRRGSWWRRGSGPRSRGTSCSWCSSTSSPDGSGASARATSLAYPVVLAGFVALFARSTYLTLRGGTVPWRGRQVAVRT